jgi:CDK-activating kinase assembly factor MAT1
VRFVASAEVYLADVVAAFNLINDIDIPGTEARIQKFRTENAALIEANIHRDEAYATALREQEEADRRQREAHARELARLEEEERQLRVQERQQVIDQLGSGEGDPAKVVARARAEHARRMRAKALDSSSAESATASALQATRALRARALQPNIPDPPHVPLQDDWYAYTDLYTLRSEGYYDPVSERVRADEDGTKRAGGYKIEEAWERALRCAVAALDIAPLTGAEEGSSIHVGGQAVSSGVDVVMANA